MAGCKFFAFLGSTGLSLLTSGARGASFQLNCDGRGTPQRMALGLREAVENDDPRMPLSDFLVMTLPSGAEVNLNQKEKGRGLSIPSAHQEPNDQTTQAKSFEELRPGQAVGVERERSHHQIQNLFVLPNQRRAVRGVQLRNLLQLDLSELCHLW